MKRSTTGNAGSESPGFCWTPVTSCPLCHGRGYLMEPPIWLPDGRAALLTEQCPTCGGCGRAGRAGDAIHDFRALAIADINRREVS